MRNLDGFDAFFGQGLVGTARGENFNPHFLEIPGEFKQAGFIGHADEGTFDSGIHGVLKNGARAYSMP